MKAHCILPIVFLILLQALFSCNRGLVEQDSPDQVKCLPEGVPVTLVIPFDSPEAIEVDVTTKAEAQWKVDKTAVRINCQSDDSGSGVSNYLLFVSTNGGDFIYKGQYQNNFIDFTPDGGTDAVYDLCVFVVDNVGNTERVVPAIVETVTGIQVVSSGLLSPTVKVYTLDGRYVGNSLKNLPQGIYVIDGQKYVVR